MKQLFLTWHNRIFIKKSCIVFIYLFTKLFVKYDQTKINKLNSYSAPCMQDVEMTMIDVCYMSTVCIIRLKRKLYISCQITKSHFQNFIGLQPIKTRAEWDSSTVLKQIFYEYHPLTRSSLTFHYFLEVVLFNGWYS